MRTFVAYGPVDVDAHCYAPRTDLLDFAYHQLLGENMIDDDNRHKYEALYTDPTTGVVVQPVFVATGS
ncbi:MAG: hypothetical protein R3E79_28980 [Caldilineaceae bacterium]